MKKLSTLLILLSLGLFTVGTIAGCGGDEKKTDAAPAADSSATPAADAAPKTP